MKRRNKLFAVLIAVMMLVGIMNINLALAGEGSENEVYIIYTNDIHSYIYNTVKNEAEEEVPGLRMSKIAALVQDMRDEGKQVILVDAGDEIQGDVYGAFDEGESVIALMNACGYQLATPGNHEFDYGMFTLFNRVDEADYPYITCNFHALDRDEDPFAPCRIFEMGSVKVAFVGITAPETITSSTPTYFQNEKGEYIYTIDGIADKNDLYKSVQDAIDSVREEADYVIALAHVGIGAEAVNTGVSSYDVIANVSGLDAYIDGHSHSTMEGEKIKDRDGREVILTQTGCYLASVGVMQLSGGDVSTSLVKDYEKQNAEIAEMEDGIHNKIMDAMGEKVANLENTLYIYDPENPDIRLVRSQEMNSADFIADSTYWYFNDKLGKSCDIAFMNGGGVRTQLEAGEITYLNVKAVQPFGNMICLIEASGQTILDALEMSCNLAGKKNEDGRPAEFGGFLDVAGLKFTVDSSIPCSVVMSGDGMFQSVDGEYRVKDVMVYNRASGEYEALELDKMYTVGGSNYYLRNNGNGMTMFAGCSAVVDFVDPDYVIMAEYMKSFGDGEGLAQVNTSNSPLAALKGYLIDYENPFGAGRIIIQ